jgi:hypothetical protein
MLQRNKKNKRYTNIYQSPSKDKKFSRITTLGNSQPTIG